MKNELTKSHQDKSQKSPKFLEIPPHLKIHKQGSNYNFLIYRPYSIPNIFPETLLQLSTWSKKARLGRSLRVRKGKKFQIEVKGYFVILGYFLQEGVLNLLWFTREI